MSKYLENFDYWDRYYAGSDQLNGNNRCPSQFATFVLSEYIQTDNFFDIGCGNGRDSFFFAAHGKRVVAIDASVVAVNQNSNNGLLNNKLRFEKIDFRNKKEINYFLGLHKNELHNSVIYSRFFIHAIDFDAQENFIYFCRNSLGPDGVICIEFRTNNDTDREKITDDHYRRFVDPVEVGKRFSIAGFENTYLVAGTGYAKKGKDDAHVARMIFRRIK